jgi:FtsP/CotA-like multicopper oxidase with cupredoxin domain
MIVRRRQFFYLTSAAAGAVLAAQWGVRASSPLSRPAARSRQIYISTNGLLELDLVARQGVVSLGDLQAHLMSYNGQVPGPRLEVKAGDRVRIHFENALPQPTNLHYHGLHVTPTGHADNPFLSIPPGEKLTYEFVIPQNHPAGTFWYHPHHHGVVAEQLFSGLAGTFVVRGELDEIPEIQAAREEWLVLKDFDLDGNGRLQPPTPMSLMMGREGSIITVNGRTNPELAIARGGLLRLRLLNASSSRVYRLSLENHPLYLIATDGGAIAAPIELPELLLAPGERADVLVRGDSSNKPANGDRESGTYRLLNLPYDRGAMGMMGMMDGGMMDGGMMGGPMGGMMHEGTPGQSQTPQTLATLVYRGSMSALPLPNRLVPVESLSEPDTVRRLELSMSMGMGVGMETGMGMAFTFNGKTFDPNRVDTEVKLGTTEDWELVNVDPDRMDHPFHLHINPFQVISRNGQPEPFAAWKDTVLVRGGETVRIRIPFRDFAGKSVYHCHILDHEDLGMMGVVEMKA